MKNMNFRLLTLLLFLTISAFTQKKIDLLVKYDSAFERYEVYAKPNFSQKNFTWGPSQITLVIPSNILIEKIQIRNVDGGTWEDNSVVIAPEVMPHVSFHGISSGGDKVDMIENYESLLFYFSLPKGLNPDLVRLFDNQNDPVSTDVGMLGGDFRNTIVDITGEERFSEVLIIKILGLNKPISEGNLVSGFDASVYPNVIRNNNFSVKLNGIEEKDGEVLMILTDLNGKEISRHKLTKTKLEEMIFNIPLNYKGNTLLGRFITSKGASSERIISDY